MSRKTDDFLAEFGTAPDDIAALEALLSDVATHQPRTGLRATLLDKLDLAGRFDRFAEAVAAMADVPLAAAKRLLDSIDNGMVWEDGPLPTISACWVDGGPKAQKAIRGFVRLEAGSAFPTHGHLGEETLLVLQGTIIKRDGGTVEPGETWTVGPDIVHDFTTEAGAADLLYFVVAREGVVINGVPILHRDG